MGMNNQQSNSDESAMRPDESLDEYFARLAKAKRTPKPAKAPVKEPATMAPVSQAAAIEASEPAPESVESTRPAAHGGAPALEAPQPAPASDEKTVTAPNVDPPQPETASTVEPKLIPTPEHTPNERHALLKRLEQEALRRRALRQSCIPIRTKATARDREKTPTISSWLKYQTTLPSESQIRSWFNPATADSETDGLARICGGTDGTEIWVFVIDLDNKKGKPGVQVLSEWAQKRGVRIPDTWTIRTPSRGEQLEFAAPADLVKQITNQVKLLENVDTRSHGGYSLIPPSPGYEVINDRERTMLPESDFEPGGWVHALLNEERSDTSASANGQPGRRVLSDETIRILVTLIGPYWQPTVRHILGLSLTALLAKEGAGRGDAEAIIALLMTGGNDDETKDRIGTIRDTWQKFRDGKTVRGYVGLAEALESEELAKTIADVVMRGVRGSDTSRTVTPGYSMSAVRSVRAMIEDPKAPPTMLVKKLIIEKDAFVIAGPTYGGKSSFALAVSVAVALGLPVLGHPEFTVSSPRPTVYFYAEHSADLWERSLLQVLEAFRSAWNEQHPDQTITVDRRDVPIYLVDARTVRPGGTLKFSNEDDLRWIVQVLQDMKANLAFFDPLSVFTGVEDENAAAENIRVARGPLDRIIAETGTTVGVIQHSGKEYIGGKREPWTAAELVRGSGDIIAMTSGIIGVWYAGPQKDTTKLLTQIRGPRMAPRRLHQETPPPVPSKDGKILMGDLDSSEDPGARPFVYDGEWETSQGLRDQILAILIREAGKPYTAEELSSHIVWGDGDEGAVDENKDRLHQIRSRCGDLVRRGLAQKTTKGGKAAWIVDRQRLGSEGSHGAH